MRFVETETFREVAEAVDWARRMRWPIAVTGPAGIGKTSAIAEVARRDRSAAFVTVMPSSKSMRTLLRMTCEAFGYSTERSYRDDLHDILRHQLPHAAEDGRFLIVDEVQLLGGLEVLELVKFSEVYGLPVVLSGNEHAIKRTRANAAAFDQISSRIGRYLRFEGVSEADLIAFCVEHNVEGRDGRELIVRFGKRRYLREVVKLLCEARQFAGERGPLRRTNIADAMAYLYGAETVRAIGQGATAGDAGPADVIPISGRPGSP